MNFKIILVDIALEGIKPEIFPPGTETETKLGTITPSIQPFAEGLSHIIEQNKNLKSIKIIMQ